MPYRSGDASRIEERMGKNLLNRKVSVKKDERVFSQLG